MGALDVLCLKGTAKIIAALRKKDSLSYSELRKIVGFATTASRSLKALQKESFVNREVLDMPYRPVAYSLTEKGRRLSEIMLELEELD